MKFHSGGRSGKSFALDVALSARTGTPREMVRHMREEGGTFTMANGERILFCSPDTLNKPVGFDDFNRWLKRG